MLERIMQPCQNILQLKWIHLSCKLFSNFFSNLFKQNGLILLSYLITSSKILNQVSQKNVSQFSLPRKLPSKLKKNKCSTEMLLRNFNKRIHLSKFSHIDLFNFFLRNWSDPKMLFGNLNECIQTNSKKFKFFNAKWCGILKLLMLEKSIISEVLQIVWRFCLKKISDSLKC